MKIKNILLLLLFIIKSTLLYSQTLPANYTISGYVEDAKTNERLIGANVYNAKNFVGTTTNDYGFYSLTLPSLNDSIILIASFVGFEPNKQTILLNNNQNINIKLNPNIELETVVITSKNKEETLQQRTQMSTVNIPIKQIKSLPAFMGEVDIIKALQLLPGVHSGSEGSSGMYVRGGGPDQNLILLDGVPVYNVSHLFGFFSVFNADAINNVELIKGGFPARYGGRLSSVVDIRMKEGNQQKFAGAASIGLISSKLTLEAPLKKEKTSFIISARRTYIDLLLRPIIKAESGGNSYGGYYFYDLNAKLNHKFSDKDRLYVSGYFGKDKFYFNAKDTYQNESYSDKGGLNWGNATAVVRWNHIITPKLFSNLTATYSNYKLKTEIKNEQQNNNEKNSYQALYYSSIQDINAKYDIDFMPNPKHFIKIGTSVTHHTFKPGATQFKVENPNFNLDTLLKSSFTKAIEPELYIEDDILVSNRLKSNVGLHFTAFAVGNKFYSSVQPRLALRYLLNEKMSLKASYALMQQNIHLLATSNAVSLPTDLWVPATGKVKPQVAHQTALGWAYQINNNYEVTAETYYKKMLHLIDYKDGASYEFSAENWQDLVAEGNGDAYGLELFCQKKEGKFTGWIGYTLAWTNRQFDDINFGKRYDYKYDRRHDISIVGIYHLKPQIEISGTWVYGTGNAVSLPTAQFVSAIDNNQLLNYYEGRNEYRMKSYHRLDASITFVKQKKNGERSWNISVYNAYNRKNPFFIYKGINDLNGNTVLKQVSIFPILPSFSWTRSW